MQSMGFLLFLAILLGIAIAQNQDPAFTTPDYSNPGPLQMPNDNGPMFRSGWDQNCPERNRAQMAFVDAILMAQRSIIYLNDYIAGRNDGSMYKRYFAEPRRGNVLSVLTATYFNVRLVNDVYQQVTDPGSSVWNANMKYIDMRYDAFPLGTYNGKFDRVCRDPRTPNLQASTIQGDNFIPGSPSERVLIVLCKFAFAWPDLPASNDYSKCGGLQAAPYSTEAQFTLASIMFHELLHDRSLHPIETVPSLQGFPIRDFVRLRFPTIPEYYPPDGYGPWAAMELNLASIRDQTPQADFGPLLNADSYTMFAQLVMPNSFSA